MADDGETFDRTNTDITFLRLRDDLIHEANRLKAEIYVLAEMLEEERQLRRGRRRWAWIFSFRERVNRELGHTLHEHTCLEQHLRPRLSQD